MQSASRTRKRPSDESADFVRLGWKDRTFAAGEGLLVDDVGHGAPVAASVEERTAGAGEPVRLVRGDALDVARALAAEGLAGQVGLVYVDPPFASERSWT